MITDSISYAAKSLAKRRLRSYLTIIGIFIGIAAVVALISLGQGMRDAIIGEFSGLGTDRITVQPQGGGFGPPGLGAATSITKDDLRVVKRSQHVQGAAGRLIRPVTFAYGRQSDNTFIATFPNERDERDVVEKFFTSETEIGRFITIDDRNKVALGHDLANDATWDEPIEVGKSIEINGVKLEVVGIVEKTGNPTLGNAIFINEDDAREILDVPEEFNIIVAWADSPENVNAAKEAIEKDLRKSRGVEERREDFEVGTSADLIETFDNILGIVTGVLVGIAAISLLVGGIGIMNTMYTAVLERTREIGIMKAIGATNGQILQIFILESGMLGLVGGVIGVLLGMGLSKLVELGAVQAFGPSVLQATTPLWLIIGALSFGFIVGMASGTFPARRAARLQPVEALR